MGSIYTGHVTEGGNFVDPEGGLFIRGALKGIQTGEVKTHMSQSQAGLGAQGSVVLQPKKASVIPEPKDDSMPDG